MKVKHSLHNHWQLFFMRHCSSGAPLIGNVICLGVIMIPNLVVSGMFMEMSRGFLNQEIEFKKDKNLDAIEGIPEIVQHNIKFTQFAGAVIFSISSLEAYVNLLLYNILFNRFQIDKFSSQENYEEITKNMDELKTKYFRCK
jgi:hypothetical protein